jgi:arginase family enzyme
VTEVYLHIDMDSLDPRVAPGVVIAPVPGGISLEDMEDAIRTVFARFRLRAVTLTVYDPDHDEGDRRLRTALRLIDILADGARVQRH